MCCEEIVRYWAILEDACVRIYVVRQMFPCIVNIPNQTTGIEALTSMGYLPLHSLGWLDSNRGIGSTSVLKEHTPWDIVR